MQTIIDAHAGQLTGKDEMIRSLQEQLAAERERVETLSGQMDTARARARAAEAEATREREERERIQAKLEAIQQRANLADSLEAKMAVAEESIERERKQVEALTKRLETAQAKGEADGQTIERLQAQLVQATSIEGLMERIGALQQLFRPETGN